MNKKPIKIRKNRKLVIKNDPGITLSIIGRYRNGEDPEDISLDTGWLVQDIRREVTKFFGSLKDILETETLVAAQAADSQTIRLATKDTIKLYKNQKLIDKDINANFIEKISLKNDTVLTQEEIMFCYLLVHEGDEKAALESSGLAGGLTKSLAGYKRAIKLRCLMLKGKRNLIRYINELQINYAKDLNIGKESIQTEIIKQLRQLTEQNDRRNAPTIAKLTEQLGRTVGAFTDKISIEEVSFDDAMDRMLEMRKADICCKEVSQSGVPDKDLAGSASVPASTFVYDPEKIG